MPVDPPRLILVTPYFWPSVGREARYAVRLVERLPAAGWPVAVVTTRWHDRWPRRIVFREMPVTRLDPPPHDRWRRWRLLRGVRRWLRENVRPDDVVWVVGMRHEAVAVLRAVGQRAPVVLYDARGGPQGDCRWQAESREGAAVRRRCLRADAIVGASRIVRDELSAAGYPRDQIHRIPPGAPVAPPRTRQHRADARRILAEAGEPLRVPDWTPVAVYLGRLDADRGLPYLVAAWEPITQRWPNARLWLTGPGSEREHLSRQLAALRLTGRIQMLGVFEETETLLAAADVLVHPAEAADPSLAVVEGLGTGLPVVATDSPGHRAIIRHEENGLLVPPRDAEALAAALHRVIDSPPLANRLGQAGRRWVAAERSLDRMVEEHVTLLNTLTPRNGEG